LIAPRGEVLRTARRYRGDSLILETQFETAEGAVTLIDFMPPRGKASDLVRIARGEHGRVEMRSELVIRFDYGSLVPWVTRADGEWRDAVTRSLITLKALTFRPTGGIVAAPTTSLPEQLGGPRNWDYRFCWLRDATFTLLAMMNCGYYEEAEAWRAWLLRALAGDPAQVQIMYGIAAEHRLTEWEVPWLAGYQGAR